MNTNRNTDQLFQQMRNIPVEIPIENVKQFVIAQAALGITVVAASKGIFAKTFLKFHLNSILIMTTTITASLVSIFVWTSSHGDKIVARPNSNSNPKFEYSAASLAQEIKTETDTPTVTTVKANANGENVSVTTVKTETGTNIKIVTTGSSQTSVYYNTPSDSNYVFAYASENKNASTAIAADGVAYPELANLAELAELPELPEMAWIDDALAPLAECASIRCQDSLMTVLEKSLLKDGLISDTLKYTFKINGSYMKVNGKKVDKNIWKKYKEIIENKSPNRVNRNFTYAISRDGEDTSMNLENYVD